MNHILDSLDPKLLGEKLRLARTACGIRQEDAAAHISVARTTLVAMEKGERRVKARELHLLTSLYGRSVSDWLEDRPASVPLSPQFRTPPRGTRLDAQEIYSVALQLEELARDYIELERMTDSPMVQRYPAPYKFEIPGVSVELRGEEIAGEERMRLGLGDAPILDLRGLLEESVGIRIFYQELPSQVGGLYAFNEAFGACIAINRKHPPARAVWSLAHEYGHFLTTRHVADVSFWDDQAWGKNAAERFADAFAKNFLMPRMGVNRHLSELVAMHGKGITAPDVLALAQIFRVSAEAMFLRLEDLRRLPFGTWDGLIKQRFKPDQARKTLGLSHSAQREALLPVRYRMLAREVYDQGEEMTEAQLARFLRLDLVAARQEIEELRTASDTRGEYGFVPVDLGTRLLVPA
jgi:Zn-dependent peptidase ImmA (M78 family)/DNA-binding XRE family transcriptional regulator